MHGGAHCMLPVQGGQGCGRPRLQLPHTLDNSMTCLPSTLQSAGLWLSVPESPACPPAGFGPRSPWARCRQPTVAPAVPLGCAGTSSSTFSQAAHQSGCQQPLPNDDCGCMRIRGVQGFCPEGYGLVALGIPGRCWHEQASRRLLFFWWSALQSSTKRRRRPAVRVASTTNDDSESDLSIDLQMCIPSPPGARHDGTRHQAPSAGPSPIARCPSSSPFPPIASPIVR